MIAFAGFKAYMPAFWSLPNLFLAEAAAAGSIGLINSVGNLGGFLYPHDHGQGGNTDRIVCRRPLLPLRIHARRGDDCLQTGPGGRRRQRKPDAIP